jgi:hypothetical protein
MGHHIPSFHQEPLKKVTNEKDIPSLLVWIDREDVGTIRMITLIRRLKEGDFV